MNDEPDRSGPPATELRALALSDAEFRALLERVRARPAEPPLPALLWGFNARRTRQLALLSAAAALAQVALIALLPGNRPRAPLEQAVGTTLLEGRPLTPRDVYLFHLWGKP